MKNANYRDVSLKSGFLHEKQLLNRNVTLDAVYDRFYETGRVNAFDCDWTEGADFKPHVFWDSDIAKWIEAAAYVLQKEQNEKLEARIESIIDKIEKNQCEDGYFNSYYISCEPENRFTVRNNHELYCAGHLFEAAVAYYEATGKDRFLNLMEKYADYIHKVFVVDKSASFTTPGHEEIELALVRMYRATGKKKFLELAAFFINNRGTREELSVYFDGKAKDIGIQAHLPVREQHTAVGHCVRACYLYSAMADYAYETNDKELYNACRDIFFDIVNKKMYITGGIGSTRICEAFTIAYDLRNDKAYAETCAAISLMFFAQRMLQFENNAIYADVIERILYNGMIVGLSLDGSSFFYENPLEINLKNYKRFIDSNGCDGNPPEPFAITQRVKVFGCSCCPPNLNRVLASLGDYIYGYENKTLYVNQFAGSEAEINGMKITQTTDFPKSGEIKIFVSDAEKLCVRIPSWCDNFTSNAKYVMSNGYAVIENPSKEIIFNFEMTPVLMQSNAQVEENNGKAAVCCGPYVCCAESIDNIENLHEIFIDKNFKAESEYSDELCGFCVKAKAFRKITDNKLYSRYDENFEDFELNLIPYAAFANRGESNMCVWLNVR